jgi:CHAD domain-containing protein
MKIGVTSFTAREKSSTDAIADLVDLGFELGPSANVTRTLLDTFDGRLHNAGLRLELRESDDVKLILSGDDAVTAHLSVSSVPRRPNDLPSGPFRARLAALIDVRVLLARVSISATRTTAALRDQAGKTVATANIFEHLAVEGHGDVDIDSWTIELEQLTGYAKHADKVVEKFKQLGFERLRGDTLVVAAASASIALAGFTGSPTVPLDPLMPAIDGFRSVLANLAESIVVNWQGTIDRLDPEFLHDLRVAVRRTRSVIGQGKRVLPPEVAEHAADYFAWLGGLTGPARDLDVYLLEWASYTGPLGTDVVSALEPVRAVLEQRLTAAYTTLALALQSVEALDFVDSWRAWLGDGTSDVRGRTGADLPLGHVVAKRIVRAQSNLVKRARLINPDTPPERVHDVRKDAKKLRYLLECFGGLLPGVEQRAFVRCLKSLQDTLGEHQDAEVHGAELRTLSRELHDSGASSDTILAIGLLIDQLDRRRIAARVAFAEVFAAYDDRVTRRAFEATLHEVAK